MNRACIRKQPPALRWGAQGSHHRRAVFRLPGGPPIDASVGQKQRDFAARNAFFHARCTGNAALYTSEDEARYWNKRYSGQSQATYEWYRGYASLRPVITRHVPRNARVLQVGVGNSTLQLDMVAQDGYSHILNVDYADVVIEQLRRQHAGVPQLSYEVADARSMPQYATSSFGAVLDKGTLCALLCGECEETDAAAMLSEVARLTAPGGVYVMITWAAPRSRLRYLSPAAATTTTTPPQPPPPQPQQQPGLQAAAAGSDGAGGLRQHQGALVAPLASRLEEVVDGIRAVGLWSRALVYEVGQQGEASGPLDALQTELIDAVKELPRLQYSHFVYVFERSRRPWPM